MITIEPRQVPFECHPVTGILPVMPEADFQELKRDIKDHGIREPIWLYNDQIIDGRHRYRAAQELGIEPVPVRFWDGNGSLVDFVLSVNFYRRHLNESQRALAAARAKPFYAQEIAGPNGEALPKKVVGRLSKQAADDFAVGRATVDQAAAVLRDGDPALVAAIESGKCKVGQAYHLLDLPQPEQATVAAGNTKEIRRAADAARFRKRIGKLIDEGTPTMEFQGAKFALVLADPPWQYEHPVSDSRDVENQYPTMTLDAIGALPVKNVLTEDAMLFLWCPPAKVEEAIGILNRWGFSYRSQAIWVKPSIGPGYYFRAQHEVLLVGSRGAPITPLPENRVSSVVNAPRREHSRKPDEIYDILERMYPDVPKIELFARRARAGWVAWGLEAPKTEPTEEIPF